ncbi:hypothetical protein FHU33_4606 [Blastococcus colisei]|uniref:Uncharacterized protein n=2 Tax=Blastococcus colisei TaxID=1564162 RepID=A0A543P1N0_9ACTN|nr:hypothetical protein FHU33_4606 [Blastococcus colisei]
MWVLGGLAAWLAIALVVAVVIGRSIRLADRRAAGAALGATLPQAEPRAVRRPAAVRERRRAVPVPALGVALFAIAVALETTGYVVRLTGATGETARLLSMDAPFSLPRMYVAALFAAAAFAALAGAGSIPGRRTWWLAVGAVAGGIAAVKAGSTVHATALQPVIRAVGAEGAFALSALAATAVVGTLWFLSRTERRDRRRILSVLALYAGASVGLSAVSGAVAEEFGRISTGAAAATFVEESGEALAGVGFLVAVLVGVAPRLVLPAAWALRRSADAHTLELPEAVPGRATADGAARH